MRNLYANPIQYKRGSNQYRTRVKHNLKVQTWLTILLIGLIIAIPEVSFFTSAQLAHKLDQLNRSVTINVYAAPKMEMPTSSDQQREIVAYVKEVFGRDADKAFTLLSCENHALNPEAKNNAGNTPSDSWDLGLFQINTAWQGVSNRAFLFDYKINTLMAYSIFTRNGYSFARWTCGRKMSI